MALKQRKVTFLPLENMSPRKFGWSDHNFKKRNNNNECGSFTQSNEIETNSSKRFLISQLSLLAASSVLCDLTIICNSYRYKIHRAVLSAQSPKFRSQLLKSSKISMETSNTSLVNSDNKASTESIATMLHESSDKISVVSDGKINSESNSSKPLEVVVSGIAPSILEDVLDYMYSGKFVFSDSTLEEVLEAADQMDLIQLKNMGFSYLQNYSFSNIFNFIDIAYKYGQHVIYEDMLSYAQRNFAMLISKQRAKFLNISSKTLSAILLHSINKTRNELSLLQGIILWMKQDKRGRSSQAIDFLQKVNWAKLTPRQIEKHEKIISELFTNDEYLTVMMQAYKFHALKH